MIGNIGHTETVFRHSVCCKCIISIVIAKRWHEYDKKTKSVYATQTHLQPYLSKIADYFVFRLSHSMQFVKCIWFMRSETIFLQSRIPLRGMQLKWFIIHTRRHTFLFTFFEVNSNCVFSFFSLPPQLKNWFYIERKSDLHRMLKYSHI